jgi:hypothetical protein
MRTKGDYALHQDDVDTLAHVTRKGCGFLTTSVIVVLGFLVLWPRPPGTVYLVPEAIAVVMLLLSVQIASGRMAQARIRLAALRAKRRDHRAVIALLLPLRDGLLWLRNSRFDRTGEGHYLLAVAAKTAGEEELAAYALAFLRRFRKGPWLDKLERRR